MTFPGTSGFAERAARDSAPFPRWWQSDHGEKAPAFPTRPWRDLPSGQATSPAGRSGVFPALPERLEIVPRPSSHDPSGSSNLDAAGYTFVARSGLVSGSRVEARSWWSRVFQEGIQPLSEPVVWPELPPRPVFPQNRPAGATPQLFPCPKPREAGRPWPY